MYLRKYLFFTISLICLYGCGPFSQESRLVGSYFILSLECTGDAILLKRDAAGQSPVIEDYVFAVGWNDDFIIAKRYNRSTNSGKVEWYIIKVDGDIIVGPLEQEVFDEKRKNLKVPDDLDFSIEDTDYLEALCGSTKH